MHSTPRPVPFHEWAIEAVAITLFGALLWWSFPFIDKAVAEFVEQPQCHCEIAGPCQCGQDCQCGHTVTAAPDRKERKAPEQPKEKPVPSLIGETNWGAIGQNGRALIIQGHPFWSATGQINKDGTVSLLWTFLSTGETAPSHYHFQGENLKGTWGFADQVTVSEDGKLSGEVRSDWIIRKQD